MSTFLRVVTAFALGAAISAGGYAWWLKTDATRKLAMASDAESTCKASLDECTRGSVAEKNARESTASELDASRAELLELRQEHEETEKRLAALRTLTEKFRKMIDSGKLEVVIRHGRMIVKLPAGVLFASGSAELSKDGKDALREVAGVLKQVKDQRLMVAGHTDNVPVGQPSPFKNNLELSTSRALVVAEHLIASGIPAPRLVAAGYGEHEPVKRNHSEPGRQENRRIEIVLLPNVVELPPELTDGGAPQDAAAAAKK